MPSIENNSEGKPLNILDGRHSPGFLAIDPSRIAFPEISSVPLMRSRSVPLMRLRSVNWGLIAAIFFSLACWIVLFGLT